MGKGIAFTNGLIAYISLLTTYISRVTIYFRNAKFMVMLTWIEKAETPFPDVGKEVSAEVIDSLRLIASRRSCVSRRGVSCR